MVKATMVHHVFSHTGHHICIERQGMRLRHDALIRHGDALPLLLSIESWMVNMDPYFMVYYSL